MLYHNAVQHKEIFKFCGIYGDSGAIPCHRRNVRILGLTKAPAKGKKK